MKLGIFNHIAQKCLETAREKGWLVEDRTFGDDIALIHSEASEALEDFRHGHPISEVFYKYHSTAKAGDVEIRTSHGGSRWEYRENGYGAWKPVSIDELVDAGYYKAEPKGVPIELADIIIRVLHVCAARDVDIDAAVALKMKYNESRPYRHGGKKL